MTNLRDEAKGRDCQVRIPSVCNFRQDTTVLAHLSMAGISGRGLKSPDLLGAHACYECHRCVDSNGESHKLDYEFVRICYLEGVMRTQYLLIKLGIVKW